MRKKAFLKNLYSFCQMSHFWKNQGKNGEKLDRSQKKQGKARSKLGKSQIEARKNREKLDRSQVKARLKLGSVLDLKLDLASKSQVKASYLARFSISKNQARLSSQLVSKSSQISNPGLQCLSRGSWFVQRRHYGGLR